MQFEKIMLKTERLSIEPTPHTVYVSITEQKLYHFFHQELQRRYIISTSRRKPSCQEDSLGTPTGLHKIANKIGDGEPNGTVFKGRISQNRLFNQLSEEENKPNLITSRILWLEGLEVGINAGDRIDSYDRYIYIHGTNHEENIGKPDSHGCVLLSNEDVIELFDKLPKEALVLIE